MSREILPLALRPKVVSPSRLARYYFQECDRYLRYSATHESDRASDQIPFIAVDETPATQAILEAGYLWEEEVVGTILAGQVKLADAAPGQRLRDRIFGVDATHQVLASLQPGEFVYQPTLTADASFYERYGLDPRVVRFADCRPDLLLLAMTPHGPRLRIIDIKASPGLKLSHRIQAAFYTLLLEPLIVSKSHSHLSVDTTAGIWLGNAAGPELFDTRHIRPTLEAFLSTKLEKLMQAPADHAEWHFYHRCEWCAYFEPCREEMRRTDDVSRLLSLSTYAKRHLAALSPPVRTITELEQLLARPDRQSFLEGSSSLEGKASRLQHQVLALRQDRIRAYGGASLALPRGEHVRLIFTLQTEPVSGHVYAFGIFAQGFKHIDGANPAPAIGVAVDGRTETITELERTFIRALHGLLLKVDGYNRQRNDVSTRKSLQAYVFDSYENELLTGLLLRRIDDPAVAVLAVELFFYFQQPDLIEGDRQPSDQVFFPTIVLVDVIARLLALPVETNIRLADAARLLKPERFAYDYQPDARFSFALSNQMRSDSIHALWQQPDPALSTAIEDELRSRLRATNSLLDGIRETLTRENVPPFAWAPRFRMPSAASYQHPLFARLAFITRYESAVRYVATRSARMAPLEDRIKSGNALRLTYLGDDRFQLDTAQSDIPIEATNFAKWLMHHDTSDGYRAALGFDDYASRAKSYMPRSLPLALAAINDKITSGTDIVLRLTVTASQMMPPLQPGENYLISPRFTDFTSDHVLSEFSELDQQPQPYFEKLIQTPQLANEPLRSPREVRKIALDLATEYGMTPSQREAFSGVIDSRLRLVWGPPGTGKTHFLALAILCLAQANHKAGFRLRVVLTGFTHASIDNCLDKIRKLQQQYNMCRAGFDVGKLTGNPTSSSDVGESAAERWLSQRSYAVLGGTVWAIRKSLPADCAEAVVIDEASQFRVPEAAIAVRRLSKMGRLIVAGDDKQLPPIVEAEYPMPPTGEPLVHRSLFECLRTADPDEKYTSTLLENWRMNDTLCRYPAAQVYVQQYQSATTDIAARRLRLAPADDQDALADAMLDPAYPLVVCVVDGVRATAENRIEAGIVRRLVARLDTRLLQADGTPYPGDRRFWDEGVFIVSPHHAQITAVRKELAAQRKWDSQPFVDTVDKMQGQECDVVIVTYGVADSEYALAEKDFIYSMNRLNVAITRARMKTIVVLSRPLIEPPLAAYESDETAAGVAFMQGLVRHAMSGQVQHHGLDGGIELSIARLA